MSKVQYEFYPKIQPKSSSERENSSLLQSILKSNKKDHTERLLHYASIDKLDCEASCILIALSNHHLFHSNKEIEQDEKEFNHRQHRLDEKKLSIMDNKEIILIQQKPTHTNEVTQSKKKTQSKNDPIMLLMAAAEVINKQSNSFDSNEKRKKSNNNNTMTTPLNENKRLRTNPPTPAPSYYQPDTWRKNSFKHLKNDQCNTKDNKQQPFIPNHSFSRQYHSMKQNPKIKQNALHTYITYMIYNDLAINRNNNNQMTGSIDTIKYSNHNSTTNYQQPPRSEFNHRQTLNYSKPSSDLKTPSMMNETNTTSSSWFNSQSSSPINSKSTPLLHDKPILSRPLTAFLWDNPAPEEPSHALNRKNEFTLPPLALKNQPIPPPPPPPSSFQNNSEYNNPYLN